MSALIFWKTMAIRTKLLRAILIFSSWLWTESRANWNPLPRFQTFPVCGSYTYRLCRKVYELALYLSQANILKQILFMCYYISMYCWLLIDFNKDVWHNKHFAKVFFRLPVISAYLFSFFLVWQFLNFYLTTH